MQQQLDTLLNDLKQHSIQFSDVLKFIDTYYEHQPTAFRNGEAYNEANQNQGSARVFAFAQINGLNQEDTLLLFAEHYQAVLDNPVGTDHQNIRQFILNGWPGIAFEAEALKAKE